MKKKITQYLQLVLMVGENRTHCYWCGQPLRTCGTCKGSGQYKENGCKSCQGNGMMCPTHESDWE